MSLNHLATVAELADAQRSGRCLVYPSTGSIPASGIFIKNYKL